MKTLADFKRRIKVGQKLHGIRHRKDGDEDLGIRTISYVHSDAFAFKTDHGASWVNFPSATNVKFYPDNKDKITMLEVDPRTGEQSKILTYTFIN